MGRRREIEGFVKQKLARGGPKQIFTPHHFCDSHFGIIDRDGELVGRQLIVPPNDEIAEIASRFERMRTGSTIDKADLPTVRNPKTPIHLPTGQFLGREISVATSPWIYWLVIGGMRRVQSLHHIAPRAEAGINQSRVAKFFERLFV